MPQYYIEESHPAIINPNEREEAQIERKIRYAPNSRLNKSSVLIGIILCAERGCAFGLKTCHSNDKYKKSHDNAIIM